MKRIFLFAATVVAMLTASAASADILFESGTLGPTGVTWDDILAETVGGSVVASDVFTGVRFQLEQPVVTSQIGGHFLQIPGEDPEGDGSFFGAIVALDDANDFPDSGDLSTPDVLGATLLTFPDPSDEVFGDLSLRLDPGWYALVFGSGLFGATAGGGAIGNNPDIGDPVYIARHIGDTGWSIPINPIFRNYRFVVQGQVVPEPATGTLMLLFLLPWLFLRQPMR